MILSKSAVYAVRATILLAEEVGDEPVRVDDIAERLDVPRNYLSKILHVLAREGILDSTRGPRGGFRLTRDAHALRLSDVVRHFDEVPDGATCLLGRERCLESDPCPAHARWKDVGAALRSFLETTSLADLAKTPELTDAMIGRGEN